MAELIVVCIGEDTVSLDVREHVAKWAKAELLRPVYFVTPQDLPNTSTRAVRVDEQGKQDVAIPDDFGGTEWSGCTVAAVRPIVGNLDEGGTRVDDFAKKLAAFLKRDVLPLGTAFVTVNMVAPTSDLTEADGAILTPGWQHTLVVSPEAREGPTYSNVLVTAEKNLASHTALALSTALGLWVAMPEAPFRSLNEHSANGTSNPRLFRTFVRVVRGGAVSEDLAREVLASDDGRWRVPSGSKAVAPAADPPTLVEAMVKQVDRIDRGALVYGEPPRTVVPKRIKVGWRAIFSAFVEYWGFVLGRIKDLPARFKAAAEKRITKRIFSDDGAFVFAFDDVSDITDLSQQAVELREEEDGLLDGSVLGQARLAERALEILAPGRSRDVSRKQAWVDLRQLILSTVDGGQLPVEIAEPMLAGAREVIVSPIYLVPNSEEPRFSVPGAVVALDDELKPHQDEVLAPCDPLRAALLDRDLDLSRERFASKADSLATEASSKRDRVEALLGGAGAAGVSEADAEAKRSETAALERGAEIDDQHESECRVRADQVAEVQESLMAWAEPRFPSLMWRIGETIGAQLDNATNDQQAAFARVNAIEPLDVAGLDRARRRLSKALIISTLLALVAGAATLFVGILAAPFLVFALLLVAWFGSFFSYTRARSALEWKFGKSLAEQANALNLLAHAAAEVARLASLYDLFVEWSEILGYQAHQPWVPDDRALSPVEPPTLSSDDSLPSLLVGTASVPDARMRTLATQVSKEIQCEGWMTSTYLDSRDWSLGRLAASEGLSVEDLDPEGESQAAVHQAREFLLTQMKDHQPQRAAYRDAVTDIEEFCAEVKPDDLFEEVEVGSREMQAVERFLGEIVPKRGQAAPGFLPGLLTSSAEVEHRHTHVTSHAWATSGIGEDSEVTRIPLPMTASGQYLLFSIRMDLGPTLDPKVLSIFSGPSGALEEPQRYSDPEGEY